ncbi:hypothetical protein F5Y14DRAFT_448786 [Nemania sp. NC0429]|nr:hypothetical protein F5Y14DRAFT_448786 [Nemania sp. NC0429]
MDQEKRAPPSDPGIETPTALPDGPSAIEDDNQAADVLNQEESWEAQRRKISLKADVEWLDFEHFKNRYTEQDGTAIIEVLVGHSQIPQGISSEIVRRSRGKRDIRTPTPKSKLVVDEDSYWMERVRIQSSQLILLLSRLTGHRDKWATGRPRTFFRPFQCFYYFLPQLKECLQLLKAHWPAGGGPTLSVGQTNAKSNQKRDSIDSDPGDNRGPKASSNSSDDDSDSDSDDDGLAGLGPMTPEMAVSGDFIDSPITLAHLTRFIDFIEKHIVPMWRRAAGTSQRKFRYSDLIMAFQPGDLLHSLPADTDNNRSNKMYQTAWRLRALSISKVSHNTPDDKAQKVPEPVIDVYAYYIDYDGISYVPIMHTFSIWRFEGERDITTLEIYPLRFMEEIDRVTDALQQQGTWFCQAITEKHLSCDGWTLTCEPNGNTSESNALVVEHIDGDVIIDFVEGYKSDPIFVGLGASRKKLGYWDDSNWPEGDDNIGIIYWKPLANSSRLKKFFEIKEKTQQAEWFSQRISVEQIKAQRILKNFAENKRTRDLDAEELLLLPCRVVAYAFRERRFVMLDIRSLKSLPNSDDVFRDLKIDSSHRIMVESLVKSHLEKQAAKKFHPNISMNQDLVRGKGSGLVILLHGVPGVGKTATAEAIAQANKKALFVITCGDLGFTPKEVEGSLKDIFRLAHLWDCILLLDEADIPPSRRELGDLKRNALVSVFLRVLEYYSGILFLTTNRIGTLDEAFKSRIHVSLYYPPLNRDQTKEIFEVNIRKLKEIIREKEKLHVEPNSSITETPIKQPRLVIDSQSIRHYAEWHYDINESSPEQRWNGRQIRNAFQVAYSLAQFNINSAGGSQGNEAGDRLILDWYQFDMVAKAVEKFENYLYHATDGTDGDRARKAAIRNDKYDHRMTPQKPDYNPTSRQWNQGARRSGQSTASNPPSGHSRPYRPPRPASRDDQAPVARNSQGRPEQSSPIGSGGGGSARRNSNIGGLSRGASSIAASPHYIDSRPRSGQSRPQPRQQLARTTHITRPGTTTSRPAATRRNNPGYHSGWDINAGTASSRTPSAAGDWQGGVAYDSEGGEVHDVGGGEDYEDDYLDNGEDDMDGGYDDDQYIDDVAGAEQYSDHDDVTTGSHER